MSAAAIKDTALIKLAVREASPEVATSLASEVANAFLRKVAASDVRR